MDVKIEVKRSSESLALNSAQKNNDDHYHPSVRLLQIPRIMSGSCGFHLSRSKWDPYPWVSAVDENTPAEVTGLKVGDCVLEVNSQDILGLRISAIAKLVKSKPDIVSLLLWSSGLDVSCDPESLCCGPMPQNFHRLSACMQTVLTGIECPVCLDTIPPPAMQCLNGHLLCLKCRARSEKCPVCRQRYLPGRCLIAEQIYNSVTDAFNLRTSTSDSKLRMKLFGTQKVKKKTHSSLGINNGQAATTTTATTTPTNKFLAKLLGKAMSLDNLNGGNGAKKSIDALEMSIGTTKQISASVADLSQSDNTNDVLVPLPRSPSPSVNRLQLQPDSAIVFDRRPCSSLNTSITDYNDNDRYAESEMSFTIPVPVFPTGESKNKLFNCPFGCGKKLIASLLQDHVRLIHNSPIVSFGSSTAEIALPLKAPVDNSVLVLVLDGKEFWMKLRIDDDGSIFISVLLQGAEDEICDYMVEARLRNRVNDRILERELITRSIVHSLMNTSWNEIFDRHLGISYNQDTIRTTFSINDGSEFLIKIAVKHRS